MQTTFILSPTPVSHRFPAAAHRIRNRTPVGPSAPREPASPSTPSCGLANHLAALAAAAALIIPFPLASPAQASTLHDTATHHVLSTAYSPNQHPSHPLAVVGVGKAAIHDYSPAAEPQTAVYTYPYTQPTAMNSTIEQLPLDDEARREFSLAVRLVTAVLLGVLLGAERRATSFNLGMRSITLISLCTALASLMTTGAESGLYVPAIMTAPHMYVVTLAAVVGLTVYAAARLRTRRTRHMGRMCWTIALGVAMGGACGAGLSLLSMVCYLAAVGVMRAEKGGVVERVRDSSVVREPGVLQVEKVPVGEGIDGSGFSA